MVFRIRPKLAFAAEQRLPEEQLSGRGPFTLEKRRDVNEQVEEQQEKGLWALKGDKSEKLYVLLYNARHKVNCMKIKAEDKKQL